MVQHVTREIDPGKDNYFKDRSTEQLEKDLAIYLCMDNGGGKLADDTIAELDRRYGTIKTK